MASKIRLGGRTFEPIGESTIEHDLRLIGLIRQAGLDDPRIREGEVPADFAHRLLGELLMSGTACDMLGCLLIPDGTASEKWTPELGAETSSHIAALSDKTAKQKVYSLVVSLLIDFFERGLASWRSSESSLGQPELVTPGTAATAPGAS